MRDSRSCSFAVPVSALLLFLSALFLALFPAVHEPVILPSHGGSPDLDELRIPRTSVLRRWVLEREQRLFVERLQFDFARIETSKFKGCRWADPGTFEAVPPDHSRKR
jgi:hypothetical protein